MLSENYKRSLLMDSTNHMRKTCKNIKKSNIYGLHHKNSTLNCNFTATSCQI
jgi:hypothetical protein